MKKSISIFLFTLLILSGCGSNSASKDIPSTETKETVSNESKDVPDTSQKEAPQLVEQVASGKLPPLSERLPVSSDIMIEPDIKSLGQYGGSITVRENDNGHWDWAPWTEQSMFRFKQDGSGDVEANVCKEYSANDDFTVWTIKLREGMKWSDGQPFTADDILFYYNHMSTPALNEDRTAKKSEDEGFYTVYTSKAYNCYQVEVEGKKKWAVFEKVNDYEFTVAFEAPKPSFPNDVAIDNKWMFLPKHFYINYVARKDGVADDSTFPLITEEQAVANANKDFGKQWESYSSMGKDIGYYHWDYAIVPQIRTFIAVKDNWKTVGETYELVRNPYFWKTDSEGRQLPYLDSIKVKIINEQDQVTLQAMSGEFDVYAPEFDFATIATNLKDSHNYVPWQTAFWSTDYQSLQLNQTVKDLDKRALFQDLRFREALSICVDRDLLNATLQNGVSKPRQASIAEGLPYADDEWANKWIEHDVDKANKLMDEITEPWDKTEGTYRKMKGTSKDVEIILSVREPSEVKDFFPLVQSAFKSIGVRLTQKVDAEYRKTLLSNDVEASVEVTYSVNPALRAEAIVPMRNVAVWHSAYGKWYEDGKTEANGGIAPTGDVLELVNAYDAIKSATGADREKVIDENIKKIYDLHKKNIWIIGYLASIPNRYLINKSINNFPESLLFCDEYRFESMARPEQLWRSK